MFVSDNKFESLPDVLGLCPDHILDLSKLRWIAFAGNPFSRSAPMSDSVPLISQSSYIPKIIGIARRRQMNDKLVWNQFEQPEAGL